LLTYLNLYGLLASLFYSIYLILLKPII